MNVNPLTCIDFYKADHRRQYPKGTTLVYANMTPRSATHAHVIKEMFDKKIVFVGLQGFNQHFLIDTWNREFFHKPKAEVVAVYKRRMDTALGPNAIPVEHIEALHDLGYLPLHIKALPEGSRVNIGVPVLTIKNTHPDFFWLTNYLETVLSSELWKSCTNATIAFEYRKLLTDYALLTGSPLDFIQFQGHDFSARGMSGLYDAAQSGIGHLLSFTGTDTVSSIDYAENYYHANAEKELIGCSVPATEHSVMAMGTKEEEIETFRRLITELYPTGVVSIVSDTWDFWKVINEYARELKPEIMARQPNAIGLNKVVFRPDSGDPVEIIAGIEIADFTHECNDFDDFVATAEDYLMDQAAEEAGHGQYGADEQKGIFKYESKYYSVKVFPFWNRHDKQYYYIDGADRPAVCEEIELTPQQKGAVQCLWEIFGGTETDQGFKVLDQHVGLIYGDSITLQRAMDILDRLYTKGFASCNVVFGIGSYTYQMSTRDTFGFAIKATYGIVNGEPREIFKDPITDNGSKKSARGLLRVDRVGNNFVLKDQVNLEDEASGELRTVFLDGVLDNQQSLADIRALLASSYAVAVASVG